MIANCGEASGYKSNDPKGYYGALGISPSASVSEIGAAFRRLAKECHPDRNPDPSSSQRFQATHEAYETLRDAKRRAQYDGSSFEPKREQQQTRPPRPIVCSKCGRVTAQPRYVIHHYVISVLFYTFRQPVQGIFCAACGKRTAIKASAISAAAGWWGIPYGPIDTVRYIVQNARGGDQPPGMRDKLLWTNALAFLGTGDLALSYALARELRASNIDDIADGATALVEVLKSRGVKDVPGLKDQWKLSMESRLVHYSLLLAVPTVLVAYSQFGPGISGAKSWSTMNSPPMSTQDSSSGPQVVASTTNTANMSAPPTCATPPSNGQVLADKTGWSEHANSLEIQNGSGGNAIIKIRDAATGKMLISFFVEDNATASYEFIPDGAYRFQYAFGNYLDVSCTKFAHYLGAGEFPDAETFATDYQSDEIIHHVLSYTLYPVPSGNVHPNSIDAGVFDAP